MPNRIVVLVAIVAVALIAASPSVSAESDSEALFETLKSLEGNWEGSAEGEGSDELPEGQEMPPAIHEFRVSAAGTVVMETMNPGTDHEMINMYHLVGDELMMTHYCAGGNQPSLRLVADESSADVMVFDFAGGTNLDPAVDEHIHSARITVADDDQLISAWTGYKDGEPAGSMTFNLERAD